MTTIVSSSASVRPNDLSGYPVALHRRRAEHASQLPQVARVTDLARGRIAQQ
jgi:hypothetical protein